MSLASGLLLLLFVLTYKALHAFKFSQIYIYVSSFNTAIIVCCACPDSFGGALLYFLVATEHFVNILLLIQFFSLQTFVESFQGSNTFVIDLHGFHPWLFKLNPFGVIQKLLHHQELLHSTFLVHLFDIPFTIHHYFFNHNITAAVIIIFTNANGINFFQPRFIN